MDDDRMRPRLRALIDTTLDLLVADEISLEIATSKLHGAGVPFSVICRVLAPESLGARGVGPGAPAPARHAA